MKLKMLLPLLKIPIAIKRVLKKLFFQLNLLKCIHHSKYMYNIYFAMLLKVCFKYFKAFDFLPMFLFLLKKIKLFKKLEKMPKICRKKGNSDSN